ncbi:hypothetical protein A6J66_023000 [Yersinia enterocolitica]|nr:hypothetical protein A6J66_023000 [Yersinia enterocolitica]
MEWLGYLTWKNNTSARMANQVSRIDDCPAQGEQFAHNAGKCDLNPDGYALLSAAVIRTELLI